MTRVTGISEPMARNGVDPAVAWRELSTEAATLARQPAPTVIHFARFEQPFLRALAGGALPLDIVCTHDIARRLLPDLPRRGVRALTGYFGRGIGTLRRSADHVKATAFVWRELVRLLDDEGIATWGALQDWLAVDRVRTRRRRRVWPMPRDVRLSLPDAPGVYRMLRTGGDVLYVGKAASLRHRVNSYFRRTPSALEAALVETDEIKQHRPPYNVALTIENRACGSRHRISVRTACVHLRDVRSGRFPRSRCSTSSLRSPPPTVARSAPAAGVPTPRCWTRVMSASVRCIPS